MKIQDAMENYKYGTDWIYGLLWIDASDCHEYKRSFPIKPFERLEAKSNILSSW